MQDRSEAEKIRALIQKADSLSRRARHVIETLRLAEIWAHVGRTCFVGSARFGLMMTPNIDLEVYAERPDIRVGFDAVREIAETHGVRQIQFCNFMGTPEDPGLYWRIDYVDGEGMLWDIDNWLVPNDHPHAGLADALATAMQQALTHEARLRILSIKQATADHKPKPRGVDVYKAVMSGGVSTVEEFLDYTRVNPPAAGIETWRP